MYSRGTLVFLKHLLESGQPKATIARELGISRRLVYHLIETGQLERDLSAESPRSRVVLPAKLESFKPRTQERLTAFPSLLPVRCARGVSRGGLSRWLVPIDRVLAARATTARAGAGGARRVRPPVSRRSSTSPSFAYPRRASCYAVLTVFSYSRFLHVDWVPRQTALTVMQALERAFAAFGGVPQELLFDQMKSVIVEDHRGTGGGSSRMRSLRALPRTGVSASAPVGPLAR